MIKKDIIYLKHIRDAIELIQKYTEKINKSDFDSMVIIQDAVIRRIQVIGEAVKNISIPFKKEYSQIPWREITGMRDKIIHGYFNVDNDIVWEVVVKDLPSLKQNILKIMNAVQKKK